MKEYYKERWAEAQWQEKLAKQGLRGNVKEIGAKLSCENISFDELCYQSQVLQKVIKAVQLLEENTKDLHNKYADEAQKAVKAEELKAAKELLESEGKGE